MSYATITVCGNTGNAAEIKQLPSGKQVCTVSVAVSNGKDKPATWYTIQAWGDRADWLARDASAKGLLISATGRLQVREWDNGVKSGTALEVMVDQFTIQRTPNAEQQQTQQPRQGQHQTRREPARGGWDAGGNDDIPF